MKQDPLNEQHCLYCIKKIIRINIFRSNMGQTLSEPITAKESSSLQNTFMKVGSSSMQGWRISMEDAHTHILTMADDKDASFFAGKNIKQILRSFRGVSS